MEGFVTKRGHLITNWKVRWFVLDSGEIRYYADKTLQALKGRYILRKESIVSYHADMGLNKNVILIFTTSHPFRKRALYFSCDSPESKTSWFTTISAQLEALRTGIMVPVAAPNILETTIQSVDNLSSRINNTISNTITTVFTTCTPGNEQPHTTDADVEELLKGRPIARNVRNERSMSMDGTDMRSPVQRPVRPLSKRSTLQPGTVKLTAGEGDENGYTAADYDSSDTDGSANEEYPSGRAQRDAREGREKSGSDAPRVRQLSTGQGSAQSAFLAAEALNSPILKKRDAGNNASAASSTTSAAGGKNAAAGVEDAFLPRVSTIVAEEAAQAQQRKLNFNNNHSSKNNANSTSNNSMKAAPSQMSPVGRGQSPVPGGDGKEAARKKPSSFTADTSNSAAFSSTSSTSGNSASSSSAKAKASERAAPTVSAAEGSSSKNTAAAATPAGADPDNPWIEAHTAEGELYYYHKVSRLARWDKPDAHIVEAMESRMKDIDLAAERNLRERKEAIERGKQRERENEQVKDEKTGEIERAVRAWAMDKQRAGRELSFPELLRDLAFILPADLLLVVYENTTHKVVLDALQEFTVNSPPTEVKKAYLRVVRFVHPDKLPPDLDTASKLLVERVFIHLTQKYDLYRKAHELG